MNEPAPFDVPEDLPTTAPAVIVVGLVNGGTLYRLFPDEQTAVAAWDEGLTLAHGERAFLFSGGILLAFHAKV
jgi:hypothetical protein